MHYQQVSCAVRTKRLKMLQVNGCDHNASYILSINDIGCILQPSQASLYDPYLHLRNTLTVHHFQA